jgi:hypothetical protein
MTPKCPRCNRNLKEITGSSKARVKALVCTCGFYYSRVFKKKESNNMFWVSSMLFLFGVIFATGLSLSLFPELRHFAKVKTEGLYKSISQKHQPQVRNQLQYKPQKPTYYKPSRSVNTSTKAQKKTTNKDVKKRSIAKAQPQPQHK